MKRKIMHQNSQVWRSLWLLILVFMGGVHTASAINKDDVLSGSNVYISSIDDSYRTTYSLLNNPNLLFKVLTVASDNLDGAVSVQASDDASFSGALTIPTLIYVKEGTSWYPYAVTEISDNAFKDKGADITGLFFTPDNFKAYRITTIGKNAFEGAALTGTIQLPRTITSIGDNAFALPSGTTGTIADVVLGANGQDPNSTLNFGKSVFANRTITNLHVLGNFSYATYSDDQTFNNGNVTNLMYYGDEKTKSQQGDGNEGYYQFLSTTLSDSKYPKFTQFGKNLYLPANDVKNFVTQCTNNNHDEWIPATVNCLTFKKTTKDGSTYTLMLKSSDQGYELALHEATLKADIKDLKLDFSDTDWDIDILPTTSSLIGHVVQIDSKAFDGNDKLQSLTIAHSLSKVSCKIEGNAFQGLKSLRYLDLSDKNITTTTTYTLSRIPTETYDESVAYQYTKSTKEYKYELSELTPFGGLPAYTLVFLPKNITDYPKATTTSEKVNKSDGNASGWTRPVDENCMLYDSDNSQWYCNNFGVYDVPELNPSTSSGQKYSWYSWSTPKDFQAKNSTFYRDFKANVPSSVFLPFAPDQPTGATFYTFDSTDGSSVTLKPVETLEANTPYFIRPTADMQLTSTKEQTIESAPKINNTDNMHGVYTGQSMSGNAYGMTATEYTVNNITYPAGSFMKLGSSTYINPFRAYLTLGSSSNARILRLVISDTPTAIEQTTLSADKVTPYYNLQGMKTPHPTHGIYIHNGRKVIVK